jgi:hypothetical protein
MTEILSFLHVNVSALSKPSTRASISRPGGSLAHTAGKACYLPVKFGPNWLPGRTNVPFLRTGILFSVSSQLRNSRGQRSSMSVVGCVTIYASLGPDNRIHRWKRDILTGVKQQYLTIKDTAPKKVMLFGFLHFEKSVMGCWRAKTRDIR